MPILSIEDTLGFMVVRTARSMKKTLESRLLAEVGITAAQHTVLSTLAHEDELPLSEIGKRVFLDKPAMTGLADRLENDGLVVRRRHSTDRRVIHLVLTDKGRSVLDRMNAIVAEVDAEYIDLLSPGEHDQIREILDRIWSHSVAESANAVS
jgi:DNA-binding MarR family transcriptional regulator